MAEPTDRLPAERVISETTHLGLTLVARVTEERWVACAVHDQIAFGLKPGGTLELTTTLCKTVRDTRLPVVMNHASIDPLYCDHPTPKLYGFESYISWPLFDAKGAYFGTLCGLDPKPALVNAPNVMEMFKHFSELISLQLAAEDCQRTTSAQLLDAHQTAQLHEQFVAVLSHDLRNPLASMALSADSLLRRPLDDSARKTLSTMRSSVQRMAMMVRDLLDFSRAKLGAGIGADLTETDNLEAALRHVVTELRSANPEREVKAVIQPLGRIRCDSTRLSQLLSNLLSNALYHSPTGSSVEVNVHRSDRALVCAVHNEGPPISLETQKQLFQPYMRLGQGSVQGLGLGLYIVKQIADAHGATMDVASTETEGTRFTFTMPLG